MDIVTDLHLSGPAAQYGSGMVADVSAQLVGRFADCLKAQLDQTDPERGNAAVVQAGQPVGGLRLAFTALVRAVARFFGRLFGRRRR